MLSSSKIALFCLSVGLVAPACALVLGDFEPATTGGTGGLGGAASTTNQSSAAASMGGAGGMSAVSSTSGNSAAGTGGSSTSAATTTASASTGGCAEDCAAAAGACKIGTCVGTSCQNSNSLKDTPCSGGSCNGLGSCVAKMGMACAIDADCANLNNKCQSATCQNMVCFIMYVPANTPTSMQIMGDCTVEVCDGNGGSAVKPAPNDVPPPSMNPCLTSICIGSTPDYPPKPNGSPCGGMGGMCTGGLCGNGNPDPTTSSSASGSGSTGTGIPSGSGGSGGPSVCVINGAKDGTETGVDCGGGCMPCPFGGTCLVNSDCANGTCSNNVCN